MNKFFKSAWILFLSTYILACTNMHSKFAEGNYGIVPLPQEIRLTDGTPFVINSSTQIIYPEGNEHLKRTADFLSGYIKQATGRELLLTTEKPSANFISLATESTGGNPEGYQLTASNNNITITAPSEAGVFYGIQTLRKAIPAQCGDIDISMPAVSITDYPRFKYRGVHLDVGRHYFAIDSIKQFIDILALSNVNNFHWHLTDDQGWRIEIKKYPKLTEIGSQRKETVIGRNSGEYDGKPYGGFYTQDEIREVVAYASDRFINIIPEIDLPGHMLAAMSAYPELGCTGGPYDAATSWGVFDDVLCAGNEQTMLFIEDVLAEVIDLFPSEYIHIGGDECPKVRWKTCPKCQARIKSEGLKADKNHSAEDRLQSYVITRMGKFVNSKGRRFIGWDEILEGGLAPDATVMSWRGIEGGIEAAKQKHDVIMSPSSHLYFDYYQSLDTDNEPLAIGGYNSLERVYNFEPVPSSLSAEEKKYVIGAQANHWTEYISEYAHVEYMLLPRLAALSEVQWTEPEKKEYATFLPRLLWMMNLYQQQGYNYAKHVYDVSAEYTPDPDAGKLNVALSTFAQGNIHYTLDGTEPTLSSPIYKGPLLLSENTSLRAMVMRPGGKSRILKEEISFGPSSLKPITLKEAPSNGYVFKGAPVLVDGLSGNENYKTGRWLGFQGKDIDAVIDLKELTDIHQVSFSTNVVKGDWIMGATGVIVKISDEGKTFREVASVSIPELKQTDKDGIYPHKIEFDGQKARYVEVIIKGGKLPAWHGGAGSPAFLFVDEIEIN